MTFLDTFRLYRLRTFAKATEGLIMSCDILVMRRNNFKDWGK